SLTLLLALTAAAGSASASRIERKDFKTVESLTNEFDKGLREIGDVCGYTEILNLPSEEAQKTALEACDEVFSEVGNKEVDETLKSIEGDQESMFGKDGDF